MKKPLKPVAEDLLLRRRALMLLGLLVLALVAIGARTLHLSLINGAELAARADRQYTQILRIPTPRGEIRDQFGEVLAETVPSPSVYASPRYHPVSEAARVELAGALDMSRDDLAVRLDRDSGFVWLKRNVGERMALAVEDLDLDGVGILRGGRRIYPRGSLAAHVVGFAGSDLRGLEGVELRYDRWMRSPERTVVAERDGRGLLLLPSGLDEVAPDGLDDSTATGEDPAASLDLTIDGVLQSIVERELAAGVEAVHADAGTAIVLDPRSGAVLALASVPTFDPNQTGHIAPEARRNRAITDSFEPGSTFKAITAAAAVEDQAVALDEQIDCERGRYRVGRWTIHDHHPYGLLTLPQIVQVSSNIGTTKVAERIGRERYAAWVRRFGFGQPTTIDLPGEVRGLLRPAERLSTIDLATNSFGQGIAVTPIQLASAFAAIADGGRLRRPYVVQQARSARQGVLFDADSASFRESYAQVVAPGTAFLVAGMLERAVEEKGGTGQRARIPGVRVAGKTGTAQKVDGATGRYSRQRLSSFVGFAPAEDPVVVTLVMIDNPKGIAYGGLVAAPVFAKITSRALDRAGLLPAPPPPIVSAPRLRTALPQGLAQPVAFETDAGAAVEDTTARTPAFVGDSLRRALRRARELGIAVELRGSGIVVAQEPPAGTPLSGDVVRLELEGLT